MSGEDTASRSPPPRWVNLGSVRLVVAHGGNMLTADTTTLYEGTALESQNDAAMQASGMLLQQCFQSDKSLCSSF